MRGIEKWKRFRAMFLGALGLMAVVVCGGRTWAEESEVSAEVHLEIDSAHAYKNMEASYSEGYIPTVKGKVVRLVVPFVADGELKDGKISVELEMAEGAPFVYANYRKTVKKKLYSFEETVEAYVYTCDLQLESADVSGTYPVTVRAVGYSEQGEKVEVTNRIFLTVGMRVNAGSGDAGEEVLQEEIGEIDEPEVSDFGKEEIGAAEAGTEVLGADGSGDGSSGGSDGDTSGDGSSGTGGDVFGDGSSGTGSDAFGDGSNSSGGDVFGSGSGSSGGSAGVSQETEKIYRQPKLTLESNSLSGEELQAGTEVEFTTTFRNRSQSESVYNLKVTLKPADDSISLSKTSFYFERVYPQEVITLTTTAEVSPLVNTQKAAVSFLFEYENVQGNAYSSSEELSLSVAQAVSVDFESFEIAEQVYALETTTAGVQILNTGRATAYNVQVAVEGEGLTAKGTVLAGNLEAGAAYEGSVKVYAGTGSGYGMVTGTLTLTWEDAVGETYSKQKEFSMTIQEPRVVEVSVAEEQEETNQWWAAVLVLVVLLFGALLLVMAGMLRRSRNQIADLRALKEHEHEF
ncbi:MAG: hypothetical protein Q4F41_01280 [Eubacteriales bacterium]|nr:hypothetical protein [Eubacteriales bacterium]